MKRRNFLLSIPFIAAAVKLKVDVKEPIEPPVFYPDNGMIQPQLYFFRKGECYVADMNTITWLNGHPKNGTFFKRIPNV